jgi:type IV fimbrial biogenesis protein FimT
MKRQTAGFTITELLVVMVIIAIMLAIGVPSYKYMTNSSRMSSEINSLLGDLQYARAEAIKEGQTVSVCVSSNGTTCSGSTAWANGWIVFPDPNQNDTPAAGAVLHEQTAFTGATPDTLTPTNPIAAISFNRDGFAQSAGGAAFPATTLSLHEKTNSVNYTRCLLISVIGLSQTETAVKQTYGPCI